MTFKTVVRKIVQRAERKDDPAMSMRTRELRRRARALEQLRRHRRVIAAVGKT